MAAIDSVGGAGASVTGSVLRAADQNIAVAATLLKKITEADKNLVNTLLPISTGAAGRLNIAA
jgi:hypothetical protein